MLASFIQVFFAVFGVMDSVGNTPVFISLAGKMPKRERDRLSLWAVLYAGAILTLFVFLGNAVLDVFKVSIESFRIAGGIVVAVLGFQIIFGLHLNKDLETSDDISIVPLATPLIAGPGMITLSIILSKEYGYALTLAGIAANLAITYVLFLYSDLILKYFGKKGVLVFAKVMGLILVAIGVEFIRSALGAA